MRLETCLETHSLLKMRVVFAKVASLTLNLVNVYVIMQENPARVNLFFQFFSLGFIFQMTWTAIYDAPILPDAGAEEGNEPRLLEPGFLSG